MIRWPGGCFADQYDWRDGIGRRESRPKRTNFWVDSQEWPKNANRTGPHVYDPNAFGLHDLHGNVSEWCSDWYAADTYEQDPGPTGPEGGERRVVRGGDYRSQWASLCRSSIRESRLPTDHVPRIGFRVVLEETKVGPALPAARE